MGLRNRLLVAFFIFALAAVVSLAMLSRAQTEWRERAWWLTHTHEVLAVSEALLGAVRDAETGQRGYLLTEDEVYLSPYRRGVGEAGELLAELRALTSDNPSQTPRLDRLEELIEAKFSELAETIRLANGAREAALALVETNEGQELMVEIRRVVDAFQAEERRLLEERSLAWEQGEKRVVRLMILLLVGFAGATIAIAVLIDRSLVGPLHSFTVAAHAIAGGDFRQKLPDADIPELRALKRAFEGMQAELLADRTRLEEQRTQVAAERDRAVWSATHDSLTHLANRRHITRQLEQLTKRESTLSLLLMDLDEFKSVNDTHGHGVGDEVLTRVAQVLEQQVRSSDLVGRYGGEEFLVILPECDEAVAIRRGDAIREAIESLRFDDEDLRITTSVGVAVWGGTGESIDDWVIRADRALYKAKADGRNRVVAAHSSGSSSPQEASA